MGCFKPAASLLKAPCCAYSEVIERCESIVVRTAEFTTHRDNVIPIGQVVGDICTATDSVM
jgi:hypothetical protein